MIAVTCPRCGHTATSVVGAPTPCAFCFAEIEFRLGTVGTRDERAALWPFGRNQWEWPGWSTFDLLMMLGGNEGHTIASWIDDDLEVGRRAASEWNEQCRYGDRLIEWQFKMIEVDAFLATPEGEAAMASAKTALLEGRGKAAS